MAVMPYIDQASVACGGHAGDQHSMAKCVALAAEHRVSVGAHPSYPDRANFGRRSMDMSAQKLEDALNQQVNALRNVASGGGVELSYIKAHGALYNESNRNMERFKSLLVVAREQRLPLMVQALPNNHERVGLALAADVELIREGFADRAYLLDGRLKPRTQPGAVLNADDAFSQALSLITSKPIRTDSGLDILLHIDSLCVHGDTPEAVTLIRRLRHVLN